MSYIITDKATITEKIAGDTATLLVAENGERVQAYISVTGDAAWLKFQNTPNNDRCGILLLPNSPVPFYLMPNAVYTGAMYIINVIPGTSPSVHLTELIS